MATSVIAVADTQRCGGEFDRWWSRRGEWVEAPNLRRSGQSGVERVKDGEQLLYCKRQQGHLYRSLRYPLGRPTVLRKARALTAFRDLNVAVPEIQYFGACNCESQWRGLLVTEGLPGFVSLDTWYESCELRREEIGAQIMRTLAATLMGLHRRRWQHGCLYPKHIFVKVVNADSNPGVQVALLDLEKSRRRWTMRAAAKHDLQQLSRHWETLPVTHWRFLIDSYKSRIDSRYWPSVLPVSSLLEAFT